MESQNFKSTKLVTAFFSFLEGFPYFGQNTTRVERYLHSLASIARTGEEIVCYLEEEHLEFYKDFWNSYGKEKGRYDIDSFTNITFKYVTLNKFKHSKRMHELKSKFLKGDEDLSDYKMFHEIDWFKLQLLEQELDDNHDYFYWIDCGLSHAGLFPCSASDDPTQAGLGDFRHYSSNFAMYDFGRIFNPNLFPKVNEFCKDKLLGIHTGLVFWSIIPLQNLLISTKYTPNSTEEYYTGFQEQHSIGGIIGGHKSKINNFLSEFNKIAQLSLDNEIIPNHEIIMSAIRWHNPEWFEPYFFETWYHEDTYMTQGGLMTESEWIKNGQTVKRESEEKIQFYGFFKQIGLVS